MSGGPNRKRLGTIAGLSVQSGGSAVPVARVQKKVLQKVALTTVQPTRTSSRFQKPNIDIWLRERGQAIHDVEYHGYADEDVGSSWVEATLGPTSVTRRSNDANAQLPKGIVLARATYPGYSFKAGHMLNCDMGGNGKNWRNLTILTSSANTAMTRLDNSLKAAVEKLRDYYVAIHKAATKPEELKLNLAISVTIAVDDNKWDTMAPDCYIANGIAIRAELIGAVSKVKSDDAKQFLARVKTLLAAANGNINNGP